MAVADAVHIAQHEASIDGSKRAERLLVLALSAMLTVACRDKHEPPPPAPVAAASSSHVSTSPCHEPLAAFCEREKCTSYDVTREAADRESRLPHAPELGDELHIERGECGGTRFVKRSDMYYGWKKFFRADGVLVGAIRWGDSNNYCNRTSSRAEYGDVPSGCSP